MPQPRRRMPEVSKTARRDCCLRTMRPCSSQFYPSAPNARRKPRATTFPPLLSSTRREGKPRRYRATPLDSTARPMMRPPAHASHEPQDGALFPRDWLRRRVLFTAPADLDVFEIRLHSDAETNDLVVYTTNRRWVLDNTPDAIRSTIVTSQLPVETWHDYVADPTSPTRFSTVSCTTPTASS